MSAIWYLGLLRKGAFRIWGTVLGVAISVALLVALVGFLNYSAATMTKRATSAVPIDWQVELVPSADPAPVAEAIRKAAAVTALDRVDYADTAGFQSSTGGTVQTTGPGKAIAFAPGYLKDFPSEMKPLVGATSGILLAQQTAANLHARPGDTVTVKRVGLPPVDVKIDGVVELPDADALFQGVGLPPSAAPQAPPDNVLILPPDQWHSIFDAQTNTRPDSTRIQFHVRIDHTRLPAAPTAANNAVTHAANNLEARVAGKALVADNLGSRLSAVREDALYARVLFLFLGLPGVFLACVLTVSATAATSGRRRMEQSLLRMRGASIRQILGLAAGEAAMVGAAGTMAGFGAAVLGALAAGNSNAGPGVWMILSAVLLGFALSLLAILLPAWTAARRSTVAAGRRAVDRVRPMVWERFFLDLLLIAAAGAFFWQSASGGYQIVLAPEGVAGTAVDYKAFIGPALFWVGAGLLSLRLVRLALRFRGSLLKAFIQPIAGNLTAIVAATLSRQSPRVAMGTAMLALAVAFAISTSIFNTTYNAQARVDAELTNGSDVTVFGTSDHPAGAHLHQLAALPDAAAAVPMQHRYAYVGSDLQDMYGIEPTKLGRATTLSNAYVAGMTARDMLAKLENTPDGVLVSEETVNDFQLQLGDQINLRLVDKTDNQYHAIPFTFIGVAREFPTAPHDSFLVANASYIAAQTHDSAFEYVLMKAKGPSAALARQVSATLDGAPGLKVKDLADASHIIGSSLTAVNVKGLTTIELSFAIVLSAAASGLLLLLGFFERRRTFAILDALGASPRQMAAFVWSEGLFVLAGGVMIGAALGLAIAWMLVKLLSGVFDPPPEALSYPVVYLVMLGVLLAASTLGAIWVAARSSAVSKPELLREVIGA